MAKQKVIVFLEGALVRSYDALAETLQIPRSAALRMGTEAGLPYVRQEAVRRQTRRTAPKRSQRQGAGRASSQQDPGGADLPQAFAALQRFGSTIVSVNPNVTVEVLKAHLVAEAAVQRPPVVLSNGEFDELVDQLLDADVGDLTPVPGGGPPRDDMEM